MRSYHEWRRPFEPSALNLNNPRNLNDPTPKYFIAPRTKSQPEPLFDEQHWLQELTSAVQYFGGTCTTLDLTDRFLWGSLGTGTDGISLRAFLKNQKRFELSGILVKYKGAPSCHINTKKCSFDEASWLDRIGGLIIEMKGMCTTQDIYCALRWGLSGTDSHGKSLREFLREHRDEFAVSNFQVRLMSPGSAAVVLDIPQPPAIQKSSVAPPTKRVHFDREQLLQDTADFVKRLGGSCVISDIKDWLLWGTQGTPNIGLRAFLHEAPDRFQMHGQWVTFSGSPPRHSGSKTSRRKPVVTAQHDIAAFDGPAWVADVETVVKSSGGTCTTRHIFKALRWGALGTSTHGIGLREFLEAHNDTFKVDEYYSVVLSNAIGYDEHTWLQRIEETIEQLGGECRTIEIAQHLSWGSVHNGTGGHDCTSLRELLKNYSQLFELRGNTVKLRSARPPVSEDSDRVTSNDGSLLQKVEAAIESFGGQCTTTDIADRMLWGHAGTGTERKSLRDFLIAHRRLFKLQATSVTSYACIQRESEPRKYIEYFTRHFENDEWVQRLMQGIRLNFCNREQVCSTRDLYELFQWGSPNSSTHRKSLREFLMSNQEHFLLEGYYVSLSAPQSPSVPATNYGTLKQVVRNDIAHMMGLGKAHHDILEKVEVAVKRFGGVCSIVDVADLLLWGTQDSGVGDKSLREFIRERSDRFYMHGTTIAFWKRSQDVTASPDTMHMVRHIKSVVRSFGGACTIRDVYKKLNWGSLGSSSFGMVLQEFLASEHCHFQLGDSITPGSNNEKSPVSVSLQEPSLSDKKLWLERVRDTVAKFGGVCTTRDVFMNTEWGIPGSDSHGVVLREFLTGHAQHFKLERFSVSGSTVQESMATSPIDGMDELQQLERATAAITECGGECNEGQLAQALQWGSRGACAMEKGLRAFLKAHPSHFIVRGPSISLRTNNSWPLPDSTASKSTDVCEGGMSDGGTKCIDKPIRVPFSANSTAATISGSVTAIDWGETSERPLAKSMIELEEVLENHRDAAVMLEPWAHVGINDCHEPVRASLNAACVLEAASHSSVCVPLWEAAQALPAEQLVRKLAGRAIVLEGGEPDVFDPSTFMKSDTCTFLHESPRNYLFDVYKQILCSRQTTGPAVFICLSHQIAAACLVELVKDALAALELAHGFKNVASEINAVGDALRIRKDDHEITKGYKSEKFATAQNEVKECDLLKLFAYELPIIPDVPGAAELRTCCEAHKSHGKDGIIEQTMKADPKGVFISMFRGVEVNEEAVLFANWALRKLAREARDAVSWFAELPVGVEIVASARDPNSGAVVTKVAIMRIDYENATSTGGTNHYTCQFHPELSSDIRDAGIQKMRCLAGEDVMNDGVRLFLNMLHGDAIELRPTV